MRAISSGGGGKTDVSDICVVRRAAGASDAVAAGWGSFAIDRRAFFTNRITLSGPERPTLPEGIGLHIILYPPSGRVERQRGEGCC